MVDLTVASLFAAAVNHWWLQATIIIGGTFILEDAATVLAAMQTQTGGVSTGVALLSLYAGIVLGDIGLYGLGRLAAHFAWAARLIPPRTQRQSSAWLGAHVLRVVFASRFLPGARLPTYTACGFLGASFPRFVLATAAATLIWTTGLFWVSLHLGRVLMDYLGAWRWAGAAGFIVTLALIGHFAGRMQEQRQ
jgi:membrane protein DedA with SNARE-associated domain